MQVLAPHVGTYQEHAREMEQAQLGELRSKMSEHEKMFSKGEKQMRQLQEDVTDVKNRPSESRVMTDFSPERDRRHEKNLQRLEGEVRRQQTQQDRMQVDTTEDAKTVKNYLKQVQEMVSVGARSSCRNSGSTNGI